MTSIYIHEVIKFGDYEHMKNLQQKGDIFARPLGYFQDFEELDEAMRFDRYEGTTELHQPKVLMDRGQSVLVADPEGNIVGDITSAIIGPMRMSKGHLKYTPVFCTFSVHSEVLADYRNGKITTLIDPKVKEFGNYVLIINDYSELIRRIHEFVAELTEREVRVVPGVVEYVDIDTFHGEYGVFKKPKEYSYQNEMRIVFDGIRIPNEDAIIARIGDISDISVLMPYKSFKNFYRVRIGNLEFNPFFPFKLQQPRVLKMKLVLDKKWSRMKIYKSFQFV